MAVAVYKEMELLMNGLITTDGNLKSQAGRTYSANDRGRTSSADRRRAASAYAPVSRQQGSTSGINGMAYALPDRFNRLASIVTAEDAAYWMQGEDMPQDENAPASNNPVPPQGSAKDYNAAQEAYNKQTQMGGKGQQAATTQKKGMTDEEIAMLGQDEDKKKENKSWFSDKDIEEMGRLLESIKRARELNKARNDKKNQPKKALRYQFKRVSTTISQAKSVSQAGNAVQKAKTSYVSLKRKAASGKYDQQEISMAVTHARKMVRIAKTKLAHIKEEETADKVGLQDEISIEARERRKKEHRKDEDLDLLKADMDYLKAQLKYIRGGGGKDSASIQARASLSTAINATYSVMKKQAVKENLEKFIENSEMSAEAAQVAAQVTMAVSDAQASGSSTVAASAVADVMTSGGGFTTLM